MDVSWRNLKQRHTSTVFVIVARECTRHMLPVSSQWQYAGLWCLTQLIHVEQSSVGILAFDQVQLAATSALRGSRSDSALIMNSVSDRGPIFQAQACPDTTQIQLLVQSRYGKKPSASVGSLPLSGSLLPTWPWRWHGHLQPTTTCY